MAFSAKEQDYIARLANVSDVAAADSLQLQMMRDSQLSDGERGRLTSLFAQYHADLNGGEDPYADDLTDEQEADRKKDADNYTDRQVLREMYEFLRGHTTKDSGRGVTHRQSGRTKSGQPIFRRIGSAAITVPSRNDEREAEYHGGTGLISAGRQFRDRFATASGTYRDAGGQTLSGGELMESHGQIVGRDAKESIQSFLSAAAQSDALTKDEMAALGKQVNLSRGEMAEVYNQSPSIQAERQQRAEAAATSKAEREANSKERGAAIASVSQAQKANPDTPRQERIAALRASLAAKGTPPPGSSPSGGAGGSGPLTYGKLMSLRAKVRKDTELGSVSDEEVRQRLAEELAKSGYGLESDSLKSSPNALFSLSRRLAIDQFKSDKIAGGFQESLGTATGKDELYQFLSGQGLALGSDKPRPPRQQRQKAVKTPLDASAQFEADRRAAMREVANRYAKDPNLRGKYNTQAMRDDQLAELKKLGLNTEGDEPNAPKNKSLLQRVFGGSFGLLQAAGIGQATLNGGRAGLQVGNAVGQLVQGLTQGIVGAGSAFVQVGETLLGFVLSPFGRSGQAGAKLAAGLGGGLLSLVQAGGGLLGAGAKIGVGTVGAVAGAGFSLAGAGIGAGIGALGGAAGAGAVGGAFLFGSIASAFSTFLTSTGGAIGQFLGALGTAFGKLGGAIGDTLSSLKDIVSDLIDTGTKWAQATLTVSRTGNLSLGAAAGVASFSNVLGLGPGGLNGIFSGFGEMSQFRGTRLAAFGVPGATGTDPLGDFQKSGMAYQKMNPIQRQMLVGGAFGGNDAVGNLFSQGPEMINYAVNAARQTALSPAQTMQNAKLGIDLGVVQNQFDQIKLKFLGDLMPTIQAGLSIVTNFLSKNGSAITGSLQKFGEFLYVQFPSMLQVGLDKLLNFGIAFGTALPQVFAFAERMLVGFVQFTQGIAGNIGKAPLAHQLLGDSAANAMTAYSQMSLKDLGIGTDYQQGQMTVAARRRYQAAHVDDLLGTFGADGKVIDKTSADAMRKRLLGQADAADKAGAADGPGMGAVSEFSAAFVKTLQNAKGGVDSYKLGTAEQRQKDFETGFKAGEAERAARDKHDSLTVNLVERDGAIMRIADLSATARIRAIQRQGA